MAEYLHPGVYVTEIPFRAHPIEGVPTSTAAADGLHAAADDAHLPSPPAPDWTQHNSSDPGITFAQLLAWLSDSSLFSAQPIASRRVAQAQPGWGVVQGLAVEPQETDGTRGLAVSPGLAIAADGHPRESDSHKSAHRARKP